MGKETCFEEEGGETAGEGGDEFATGAEGLPGGEETSPPPAAEESPEPAAEGYKVEKDLPLILENKGVELPNLDELTQENNKKIKDIQEDIDALLDDD